ncbi:hypothetical protein BVY03_03660, partial [bacterium K02(2017)]
MAEYINMVRGVSSSSTTATVTNEGQTTESHRAIVHKDAAEFSTTNSYRQSQSKFVQLLADRGFSATQTGQLVQFGNLQSTQLVRVLVLAQLLIKNQELFQQLTKNLKTIISMGQNVQSGLKTYLDGLENSMGLNTSKLLEDVKTQMATQKESEIPKQEIPEENIEFSKKDTTGIKLYRELNQKLGQNSASQSYQNMERDLAQIVKQVSNSKSVQDIRLTSTITQSLQDFNKLTEVSLREFPQRYQIDLYSFSQLSQKGMDLNTYLNLSSEVSPLRLLNVIV